MAKPRVKIHDKGAQAILKSRGVQDDLQRRIDAGKSAANASAPGAVYSGDVEVGETRARGILGTGNAKSRIDNAKRNTLLKSIDEMR